VASQVTVSLTLSDDGPNTITFRDTYEGLANPWFRFQAEPSGSVALWANRDGFEHLGRYSLKLARTNKREGFHSHHQLELHFGAEGPVLEGPELTIGIMAAPEAH
jgi:hypothetical protein